jgi:multidrug efflux pump subunit AcrA (membrane-fusion protein)
MVDPSDKMISAKSKEDQEDLNKRLRSLKIDRSSAPAVVSKNRAPKFLFLGIAALLALLALGYVFLFSTTKTISAAPVRVESGGASAGESVLSASGYVVAHHKIAVGAKVMGRVAWIGVEKGDSVQQGQVLVRLEDTEFRAQVNQANANLAAAQARLDQLKTGSRPQEKMKDKAAVIQAEANLKKAQADYERSETLYRSGVTSKAELDQALAARDTAAALVEAAKQSSAMTDIGPRSEEIRAGEAQVQQMRAALDYAQTQARSDRNQSASCREPCWSGFVERGEMVSPSAFGGFWCTNLCCGSRRSHRPADRTRH